MQLIDFIRRNIRSVWALEVLLALRRPPLRAWSLPELVVELRASDAVVVGVVDAFERQGLVARAPDGAVSLAAVSCLDQLCDALADAYKERPFTVISAITCTDEQLASLADAFQLRKSRD